MRVTLKWVASTLLATAMIASNLTNPAYLLENTDDQLSEVTEGNSETLEFETTDPETPTQTPEFENRDELRSDNEDPNSSDDSNDVVQPTEEPEEVESLGLTGIQRAAIYPTFVWTETPNVRLGGVNRFETAVEISKHSYPQGASIAILVTGRNFPDALSAAALAAKLDAPLLLSEIHSLPLVTETELRRLQPTRVIIIGGEGAVSPAVEALVNGLASQVDRIGGANRYETSAAIARAGWNRSPQVFIATGANFPDALSAASAAAELNAPVILVPGMADVAPAVTRDILQDLSVTHLHIAGGTGVISTSMQLQLAEGVRSVERYAGANRYETSVLIADNIFTTPFRDVYWANGNAFPDALAGAAASGAKSAPMLLVHQDCVPTATYDVSDRLSSGKTYLLGGEGVLSENVLFGDECLPRTGAMSDADWQGTASLYSQLNAARYEAGASAYRVTRGEIGTPAYDWARQQTLSQMRPYPDLATSQPWAVYQAMARTQIAGDRASRIASLLLADPQTRSWLLKPNAGVRGAYSVGVSTQGSASFGVVFVGNAN